MKNCPPSHFHFFFFFLLFFIFFIFILRFLLLYLYVSVISRDASSQNCTCCPTLLPSLGDKLQGNTAKYEKRQPQIAVYCEAFGISQKAGMCGGPCNVGIQWPNDQKESVSLPVSQTEHGSAHMYRKCMEFSCWPASKQMFMEKVFKQSHPTVVISISSDLKVISPANQSGKQRKARSEQARFF